MFYKILIMSALCLFFASGISAQTTTQVKEDPNTGVRVTTRITPLKPLTEQIAELEAKLAEARLDPAMVANGTVEKYEIGIAGRRKQLEEEQRDAQAAPPANGNND